VTGRPRIAGLLVVAALCSAACAGPRANVTALAEQQQAYYADLESMLRGQRRLLQDGLELQVEYLERRRDNLANWDRDLRKAEVLLAVDADVTGNQRLLSYKLAEMDLAAAAITDARSAEAARVGAILSLYDQLIRASAELQSNSDALIEYLGSGDDEFALRTLDVDGVVRSIAAIRDTSEQLGRIEARSDEERAREQERVQRSIERARDLLLDVLAKDGG